MNKKNLIINSTLLFCIATCATMTIHEIAHFLSAVLFNAKEVTLYHNYASYNMEGISDKARIITAAAGPFISLIVGIIFNFICSKYVKRNLFFLFMLYMSALGYIAFGGYLLIAPIFSNGDTGFICNALHFPVWLTILVAITGVVFMLYTMKMLSRFFVELATQEIINDKSKRRNFFNHLIKFPVYIGIVITTLLNLPAPALISLAYPLFSPLNLLWLYGYCLDTNYQTANTNTELNHCNKISLTIVLVFILSVTYNRLLVSGLFW